MHEYPNTYNKFAIIPHPTRAKALFIDREGSWTLPGLRNPEYDLRYQYVGGFNDAITHEYGIKATTLGYFDYLETFSEGRREVDRFYAMENHSNTDNLPTGCRWFEESDLESLRLDRASIRPTLTAWFAWYTGDRDPHEAPWERPGWFKQTERRIDDTLRQSARQRTDPIEQVVVWTRSCVLRVRTESAPVYFKASSPALSSETKLTVELAKWFPDNSVRILAADEAHNSLLMEDYGGTSLQRLLEEQDPTLATVERALDVYSAIQIDTADRVDRLLSVGVPDRRLNKLPTDFQLLLSEVESLTNQIPGILTDEDIRRLQALPPELLERCERLGRFQIPPTLEHGDFHPGQIFFRDGDVIVTDWSDASISHPFLSLPFQFESTWFTNRFPSPPEVVQRRVREAYLQQWTRFEPMNRLIEAYDMAHPLAFLHRGLLFRRFVARVDDRSRKRWQRNIVGNLKLAVQALT
jgi:hypothetical protein